MNMASDTVKQIGADQTHTAQSTVVRHNVPTDTPDRPTEGAPSPAGSPIAEAARPTITTVQAQTNPSIQTVDPFDNTPKKTILINEDTVLKGLNIQNPKALIAELEKNGYIRNSEPTDDFAKLAGPDMTFNLSDAFGAQKDEIFYFLQGIYINNAVAKGEKETEERRAAFQGTLDSVWRRALLFRDSALKRYFELAECYYQTGNYNKAIETAQNVIGSKYNTNSRKPLFYNEAIFLSANSLYRKGLSQYNSANTEQGMTDAKQYLREALKLIHTEYSSIRENDSYLSEYCSQLLEMSSGYFELTKEEPCYVGDDGKTVYIGIDEISNIYEASVESNASWDNSKPIGWLMDKTGHFGGTFMKYFDYFTAAKTRVNYARYCTVYGEKHENKIPETVADPATVLEETFGIANDVASASRPSKGRLLYFHKGVIDTAIDLWQEKGHEFVNAFGLYSAQAHRLKALSYSSTGDKEGALEEMRIAFQEISARKNESGSGFYIGGWEIKQAYFDIVSDYLDILLSSKDKNGNSIQENIKEAAQISNGLLADTTFAAMIEIENPRLYAKIKITAENYMPPKAEETISAEPASPEGLGPWDFHDFALSDAFGLRKVWSERRTAGLWSETANNLLNVIKNPNNKYVSETDRPLLLARSYAWLGNLMKWAEEGQTDPAVGQQIIELAKGLATDEDKPLTETRKGAIMVLYKAAIEQFALVTEKHLYLEAEEASTRYQLANLAQDILEDTKIEASDPLRTAAQEIVNEKGYNNSIKTAKTALAEVIKKASAPEDADIRDNAIIDYASCLAQEISSLLSQGKPDEAFDMVEQSFIFDEKTGKISIKTLTIAKDADGKDIYPELRSNTIDTVNTRLVIANVLMARPLQDTIDGARVPTEYLEAYKAPLAEILNSPDSGSLSIKAGVSNEKIRSELSSQNAPEDFIKILENRNSARLAKIAADNILGQALKLLELKLADKNTPETIRRDMTNKYADALSVFINLRLAQGRYEDTAEIINNHFVYDLNNPPYDISVHKENIFDAVPVTDGLTAQKALLAIANARSGVAEEKDKLKALAEHISNNGVSKFIRTSAQNILLGLK